jgi:hypothetical protein
VGLSKDHGNERIDFMAESDEISRLVPVHTLADRFEADLLKSALEGEGIPAIVKSFVETAYSGLFVSQKGWGLILVPADRVEAAAEIIHSVLKASEVELLYTDPHHIDAQLWEALRNADPYSICENAGVIYNFDRKAYEIPFLNLKFFCLPEEELLEAVDSAPWHRVDFEFTLAVLHYLLDSRPQPVSGYWIGAKDIPGGEAFFRGPHQIPLDMILSRLNNRPELFVAAMEKIGGRRSVTGDISFVVDALPRVPLLFVLWLGDEEFPSAMNLLFDRAVPDHFPKLDALWALTNVVCRSVRAAIDSINGHYD